jgi:aldose 1-epimerase
LAPVAIAGESLTATLDPDRGAGIFALHLLSAGESMPLMPRVGDPSYDRDSSCFLMMPYSNRIENGEFRFSNRKYQLQGSADHAIHGDVRRRPWTTEESGPGHATFGFDSRQQRQVNWPWPFAARAEYRISEYTFSSRLTLWNRGDEPMPAGLGWHPFFSRRLRPGEDGVRLCFKTPAIYPDINDTRIPSGPPRPTETEEDFTRERSLPTDLAIDSCYRGYDGGGYLVWPQSGVRLEFDCSSVCGHLIVFNPVSRPYFAIEPVSHANNGVNLLAAGDDGCGMRVLQPGEALEAQLDLKVSGT